MYNIAIGARLIALVKIDIKILVLCLNYFFLFLIIISFHVAATLSNQDNMTQHFNVTGFLLLDASDRFLEQN